MACTTSTTGVDSSMRTEPELKLKLESPPSPSRYYGLPQAFLQVFIHSLFPWTPVIGLVVFCMLCSYTYTLPVMVGYAIHIYLDRTPERGSRPSKWLRDISVWRWYVEYFPVKFVCEQTLDPQRNYMFGYHPHGIIAVGCYAGFATRAAGVEDALQGLKVRMLTIDGNFKVPFYREIMMGMGMASCSKKSISYILNNGPGSSCILPVGGTAEALYAMPGSADLVLNKRRGFVKLAIQAGADLVPVYNFGENCLAYQVQGAEGSMLRRFQTWLKDQIGMTVALFYGRGWLPNTRGLVPHKVPMTIVIGKPIAVTKDENPTEETVAKIHHEYVEALKGLYQRNVAKYHPEEYGSPPELRIVS